MGVPSMISAAMDLACAKKMIAAGPIPPTGIAIAGMLSQTGDDLLRLPNYAEPEVL